MDTELYATVDALKARLDIERDDHDAVLLELLEAASFLVRELCNHPTHWEESGPPPVAREATVVQAARWWMRGKTAWSDATASEDMGVLLYRQELDPDVRGMLFQSRQVWPGV